MDDTCISSTDGPDILMSNIIVSIHNNYLYITARVYNKERERVSYSPMVPTIALVQVQARSMIFINSVNPQFTLRAQLEQGV